MLLPFKVVWTINSRMQVVFWVCDNVNNSISTSFVAASDKYPTTTDAYQAARKAKAEFEQKYRETRALVAELENEESPSHSGADLADFAWANEDPGKCPECGESWVWVRPGKSQAICDCHEVCPKHGPGKVIYHAEGEFKNISGYFCADCYNE